MSESIEYNRGWDACEAYLMSKKAHEVVLGALGCYHQNRCRKCSAGGCFEPFSLYGCWIVSVSLPFQKRIKDIDTVVET